MSFISQTGKEGIKATIIADSVSSLTGKRMTSFELELPRMIWAECLTHRLFSRNAASSRAIPVKKKRKHVSENPAMPVFWGKNQPGMQASEQLTGTHLSIAKFAWRAGAKVSCGISWVYDKLGLHKQLANRPTEPFERYKVVLSATEFANWFWLRDHPDAQPEIAEVAKVMLDAMDVSEPMVLEPGEWHLPYIKTHRRDMGQHDGGSIVYSVNGEEIDLETAKKVSSSCCAQVSYRILNTDIEKAVSIYYRLVESEPVHASPFEHQATPMREPIQNIFEGKVEIEDGVTHIDTGANAWSGNLMGWIQHRQLIPNNVQM